MKNVPLLILIVLKVLITHKNVKNQSEIRFVASVIAKPYNWHKPYPEFVCVM